MDQASDIFKGAQVISQIRSNQLIRFRGKNRKVENYFKTSPGILQTMKVRSGESIKATIGSARLHVHAHGKKRFVIALKYEGEDEYRYIIASDLSWRTSDIVEAYTLRWLVEVFFQDWKGNEGWGKMTKQPGKEGSSRSLNLSLLVDHCLFFHPAQLARLGNKLPAFTVGSLTAKIIERCPKKNSKTPKLTTIPNGIIRSIRKIVIKKSLLSFAAQEADRLAILLGILTTSLALIDAYQACDGPGD